jgi:TPR repeat protein
VKWNRLAAGQGYAGAQLTLGCVYDKGEGVSVDKVESVKWYRLAAGQGYAGAQLTLGCVYDKGEGVSVDKVESLNGTD